MYMNNEVFEDDLENADELLDQEGSDLTEGNFDESPEVESPEVESEPEQTSGKPVIAMSALPITGEPRVDDALGRLNDLTSLPVHEHVAVFEDVQRRLHETLADLSGQ
jgi:hypothetical protein